MLASHSTTHTLAVFDEPVLSYTAGSVTRPKVESAKACNLKQRCTLAAVMVHAV
jgi:hypothetical protein